MGFDAGDSNLYRYCNNAPTDAIDPSGLDGEPVIINQAPPPDIGPGPIIKNGTLNGTFGPITTIRTEFYPPTAQIKITRADVGNEQIGKNPGDTTTVHWTFQLSGAAKAPGYIVQEVSVYESAFVKKGPPPALPKTPTYSYFEAWPVNADDQLWFEQIPPKNNPNFKLNKTDTGQFTPPAGTAGHYRQVGVVKFFNKADCPDIAKTWKANQLFFKEKCLWISVKRDSHDIGTPSGDFRKHTPELVGQGQGN